MSFSVTLLLLLAISPIAMADQHWEKHIIASNIGAVSTVVAAEFNVDGITHVISSSNRKVVLYRAPDWTPSVIHKLRKGKCIHSATLDIDQDGDPDVVMSTPSGNPFWLENPSPIHKTWTARVIDTEIQGVHCILTADVDKDGQKDIIINSFSPKGEVANSIVWLKVPKNPHTSPLWPRYDFAKGDAPGGSHYMAFGDIDGDEWGEIAAGAKGAPFDFGNWFAFWKNPGPTITEKNASPLFPNQAWLKETIATKQLGASNILIGDLNGDKKPDFLASNGHGQGVAWFEAPHWQKHLIDEDIMSPHSLTLADFDQDGDLDGATCSKDKHRTCIYFNDGKGQFTRLNIDTGQSSYDLRAVDMDSDGDLDLLNAGMLSNNIVWYENPLKP